MICLPSFLPRADIKVKSYFLLYQETINDGVIKNIRSHWQEHSRNYSYIIISTCLHRYRLLVVMSTRSVVNGLSIIVFQVRILSTTDGAIGHTYSSHFLVFPCLSSNNPEFHSVSYQVPQTLSCGFVNAFSQYNVQKAASTTSVNRVNTPTSLLLHVPLFQTMQARFIFIVLFDVVAIGAAATFFILSFTGNNINEITETVAETSKTSL